MTTRLAPEQLEMMAEAPQTSLYPYGHFALAFRQAASDASTLAALWRQIASQDPWIAYGKYHDDYTGCYWCKAIEPGDEFPHSADCIYVRAQQAVKALDG